MGLAALLSSKVNQWTLLVGGLPVAYSISGETLGGLPLDGRQTEEVFLTAAQSLFAVAVLVSLSLGRLEAGVLLGLFLVQFLIPISEVRLAIAVIYVVLAVGADRQQAPRGAHVAGLGADGDAGARVAGNVQGVPGVLAELPGLTA